MKTFVVLVVFTALFQASAGSIWGWFSSEEEDFNDRIIYAADDVTTECLQLARWGHCAFYDCLDGRFSCGDEGYTKRISKHFCTKIDDNYDSFDAFGRLWLNRTSVCLINYMMPIYRQEQTTCNDIQAAGIQAILNCNEARVNNRTFCNFLETNGGAYNSLMGREEVMLMVSLGNRRVFQSMVSNAVGCGVQRLGHTLSSVTNSIRQLRDSVYSSVISWFS